jgi:hypothetical protein
VEYRRSRGFLACSRERIPNRNFKVGCVLSIAKIRNVQIGCHRNERRLAPGRATGVSGVRPSSEGPAAGSAGGGGGDHDKLSASKGALPRSSREQLAPPAVVVRNENPTLPVEPTVVVPPDIHLSLPPTGALGDPLSNHSGCESLPDQHHDQFELESFSLGLGRDFHGYGYIDWARADRESDV